jgi:hypothetical protein
MTNRAGPCGALLSATMLLGASPASGDPAAGGVDCRAGQLTAARFFPSSTQDVNSQWYARRLCQMGEPALGGGELPVDHRSVRCVYHASFEPVIAIRLEEHGCALTWALLDDGDEKSIRIERRRQPIPNCSTVLDRVVPKLRLGGGQRELPENVVVVDGNDWFYEIQDNKGHSLGSIDNPIEPPAKQTGAAAACQELLELHKATPAAPRIAFESAEYDGFEIKGRLSVGAEQQMAIDRRLELHTHAAPVDCSTGLLLPMIAVDVAAPKPADNDLVVLRPGEWFGKRTEFTLFLGRRGPDRVCFEVFYSRPGRDGPEASVREAVLRI